MDSNTFSLFDQINAGIGDFFEQSSEVVTWTGEIGWNDGSGTYNQRNYIYSPQPTKSGNLINGRHALAISAFYDAARMIAEDIAKLPMHIFTEDQVGNKTIVDRQHPLYRVIALSPDGKSTSQEFWETLIAWTLVWGNGYALIHRNNPGNGNMFGSVKGLELIHPNRVTIRKECGIVTYIVAQDRTEDCLTTEKEFTDMEMFHLRGVGDEDSGWPIANFARESLGITLATQTLQSNMFGNGLNPSGLLKMDTVIEPAHKRGIEMEWEAKFSGSNNAGKAMLLDGGMDFEPVEFKSTDSELLDTRKFQIEEIARWFRIPLHKLGVLESNATFNNIEQENLKYVTETLGSWMQRILNNIDRKLLRYNPVFNVEYDIRPLTLSTAEDRADYWSKLIGMGMATPNDGASDLGLTVYPEGNQHYISQNVEDIDQKQLDLQKADQELENMRSMPAQMPTNPENSFTDSPADENQSIQEPAALFPTQGTEPVFESSFDPHSDLLGRYQPLMEAPLKMVVKREIHYQAELTTLKDKFGDKYKHDEEREQKFYNQYHDDLRDVLTPYLVDLNMGMPEGFVEKWVSYRSDDWQDDKHMLIANDFIKHYLQISNMPAGIYELERPDGTNTPVKIDDRGVIREL